MWVNGAPWPLETERGYLRIERVWHPGDTVEVHLAMPVERVYAHPRVRADLGRVALQRRPLIYCLEEVDNGANLEALLLPRSATLTPTFDPALLGGCVVLTGSGWRVQEAEWAGTLYRWTPPAMESATLRAIPYCLWDNRAPGEMLVWIREG